MKSFWKKCNCEKIWFGGESITYWMKIEEDFISQKNKDNKITIHKGPTPKYNDIENNLIDFIEFNRKLNNPVTTWCIVNELFKYYPNLKNDNYLNNL